jgi:hypothetical protein
VGIDTVLQIISVTRVVGPVSTLKNVEPETHPLTFANSWFDKLTTNGAFPPFNGIPPVHPELVEGRTGF